MCIVREDFDFCFAENGLTAIKLGQDLESQSFIKFLGEDNYKRLVKFVLHYVADMEIPIKRYVHNSVFSGELRKRLTRSEFFRGTFMEFRNGMVK